MERCPPFLKWYTIKYFISILISILKTFNSENSVSSRARFRKFLHTPGRVVAKPTHQCVCAVATRRNTQNWRKKFIYYRKGQRTYFLIEMFEKNMKSSLFYFIYPANSNSRENSVILARFQCFLLIFKLVFCL